MIPDWFIYGYAADQVISQLISYTPSIVLAVLGTYLFFDTRKKLKSNLPGVVRDAVLASPQFYHGGGDVAVGTKSTPLQLSIEEREPLNRRPWSQIKGKTFCLKVENTNSHKPLNECKVTVLKIEPDTGYQAPWVPHPKFSLAAGEHWFVPLVTYCAPDTIVKLETISGRPILDVGREYTASIRATSPDSGFCDINCKIWVKDGNNLNVEKV